MSQKPILGDPRPTNDELVAFGRERLVALHNEAVDHLEYVLKKFSGNLSPSALRILRFRANDDIEAIRRALYTLDREGGLLNGTEQLSKTPSERSELFSVEETADLFNLLFDLKLNWDDDGVTEIDVDTARQLYGICQRLAQKLVDKRIQRAIWTLTGNRMLLRQAIDNPKLLKSLDITEKERADIFVEISKPFSMYHLNRHFEYRKITQAEASDLVEKFYVIEENVLRDAGLNQSSIAIIVGRLKKAKMRILDNILGESSVLTGKYERAVQTFLNYAKKIDTLAGTDLQKSRSNLIAAGKALVGSKEKSIGLATLWGDAVPLLLTRDWGITSVISTTAGATVAAVLPSGKRDASDQKESQ